MTSELKKKYGLVLKSKTESEASKIKAKIAAVFNDDDDDSAPPTTSNNASASTIRVQKAAEREHERALAEDPTIFDYDGTYEEIQAIKNEKKEEAKKADKVRESKYAENIMQAHQRRQLETYSREERQQHKEREKEGEMFADKEVFVTGAYRKIQEEVQKFRVEEAVEDRFNQLTSVEHQKMWQAGFGRTLLNDISRDPDAMAKKRKERNTRARMDNSPSPTRDEESAGKKKGDKLKKSIYSDDEEELPTTAKKDEPPKKNFEGELKPGLNRVTKKASTHAERVRRNFTPTPPSSDDEGVDRKGRRDDRKDEKRSGERSKDNGDKIKEEPADEDEQDVKPAIRESRKGSMKEKLKPRKIDKEARLAGLKEILKQRNGPAEIADAKERYLERRASGIVVPPL